jgi:ferredoxin
VAQAVYWISERDCLRCGACSILAPGIIAMGPKAAEMTRQPVSDKELVTTDAALLNCPGQAIRRRSQS